MMIARPRIFFGAVVSIAAIIAYLIPAIDAPNAKANEQPTTAQAEKKTGKSSRRDTSALDDELLKDLGPDPLAEEMADKQASSEGTRPEKSKSSETDALDQELLKGLRDGEDVGDESGDDPLSRLSRQMRDVEALIAQANRRGHARPAGKDIERNREIASAGQAAEARGRSVFGLRLQWPRCTTRHEAARIAAARASRRPRQ